MHTRFYVGKHKNGKNVMLPLISSCQDTVHLAAYSAL